MNDQVCEEAVWFSQDMLLAEKSDMEGIATAIERIHKNSENSKNKKMKTQ